MNVSPAAAAVLRLLIAIERARGRAALSYEPDELLGYSVSRQLRALTRAGLIRYNAAYQCWDVLDGTRQLVRGDG